MALTTQERLAIVRRELEYWSKCEAQAMAKVDEANRRIADTCRACGAISFWERKVRDFGRQ